MKKNKKGGTVFPESVTELVLNVSGLSGGSVFHSGATPVAAHIFAWDGTSKGASVTGYASNGSPVPIPAAAWLLGSGLFGLIGVRRRMS